MLVASLAFVVLAWVADPRALLPSLFLELASIAFTILVGFLLVDNYVEQLRREQWAGPRNYALGAIAAHVCDVASDLHVHLGVGGHLTEAILAGRNTPSSEAVLAFTGLAEEVANLANSVSAQKSTSDVAVEFYRDVKWDLDQIQTVLTPLLMHTSPDEAVIDALTRFDAARRALHNAIILHERVVTHQVMPYIVNLMQASGNLYGVLCHHWHPLEDS
jgi:hypothetical protein